MNFLEKDLEDIIFENTQTREGRMELARRGLPVSGKFYRQVPLGSYGRLDLMSISLNKRQEGCYGSVSINLYELKQNVINIKALMQACSYLTAVMDIYERRFYSLFGSEPNYKITLIGNKIDCESSFLHLNNFMNNVELFTYQFKLDGLTFTKEADKYVLRNDGIFIESINFPISDIKEMYY